jgi:hypothetical protein
MAVSYAHKLGQIIGDSVESLVEPFLETFAKEHNLFLDKKGTRTARPGTKLTWVDINGNKHDLDYVMEKGGTEDKIGVPAAFIECAWRRYTKHSRNKAQEIEGAIIPLQTKYSKYNPFIGVVLAGEFTHASLVQLKSLGFSILFIPYHTIIESFLKAGVDVHFDEDTSEEHFAEQVEKWEGLTAEDKQKVYHAIVEQSIDSINQFLNELAQKINRKISKVRIWTMFGKQFTFDTIEKAKSFILETNVNEIEPEFRDYEAEVEYNNGDIIKATYHNQNDMLQFLSMYV